MSLNVFLVFMANNMLFSFTIILVGFSLGWFLYDWVVIRKISLRETLFEKDNLAAWVEFIGAFVYPSLYLSAKAIEGSSSDIWWMDLLICIGYAAAYVVLFTLLRLMSSLVVRLFNATDEVGKITLNNEIYEQKSISAALFSVALSTIFVNIIRFIDFDPRYSLNSAIKASTVLLLTLVALIIYLLILNKKTAFFKEIFVDNNIAAAASFLGMIFAVEMILSNAILLHSEFNFLELVGITFLSLAVFGILAAVFKLIFIRLVKVDVWNEVYEQNNVGAALGQIALYVGIANVVIHFMK